MEIDFKALLASAPNPYVLLDREFRLVWMNDAYLRVTMRAREDLLGQVMFDAFPSDPASDSHRLLEGSLRRALETGEVDELALIRYDIPGPGGGMDVRYWSATHTPQRNAAGEVAYILQHTVDVTELHGLRTLQHETGVARRASAVQARNLDLVEETDRLRLLFEQAPGFVAMLEGPEHRFQLANRAYLKLVGERDVIGLPLEQALPEVVEQGFVALLDEVRSTGKPYIGRRARVVLDQDGRPEERFLDFIYQPIFGHGGAVTGIFVQGHDVTEEVEANERQKLLINELNHRVKNTLAIVQALAMQSFRGSGQSNQSWASFEARLGALAAAHNLLTSRNWETAAIADIVRGSVEATAGDDVARVSIDGPGVTLLPQVAVALAMVVHELTTNAIKYGALSAREGRIAIGWTIAEEGDERQLRIEWIESGGPPVRPPEKLGFGTRLVRLGLGAGSGSGATLDYPPEGLRCEIFARLPAERP